MIVLTSTPPERTEAAEYYFRYIDRVGPGDVLHRLDAQVGESLELFGAVNEESSLYRYEPGKWSVREVLNHVSDTERVFAYRALWFARGFDAPLPGFDQDVAAAGAGADARSWRSHVEEFVAVRAATSTLFRSLADDDWLRRGVADGREFTVRALAYITAGHVAHHLDVLRTRYLSR